MSTLDVIRVWKDEEYRLSLSDTERGIVPINPAGSLEAADLAINQAVGGAGQNLVLSCLSEPCSYGCTYELACITIRGVICPVDPISLVIAPTV
jgi:mersacidin/lichenicidin family type 2 lantibiotic